jgi:hypothetical protein
VDEIRVSGKWILKVYGCKTSEKWWIDKGWIEDEQKVDRLSIGDRRRDNEQRIYGGWIEDEWPEDWRRMNKGRCWVNGGRMKIRDWHLWAYCMIYGTPSTPFLGHEFRSQVASFQNHYTRYGKTYHGSESGHWPGHLQRSELPNLFTLIGMHPRIQTYLNHWGCNRILRWFGPQSQYLFIYLMFIQRLSGLSPKGRAMSTKCLDCQKCHLDSSICWRHGACCYWLDGLDKWVLH